MLADDKAGSQARFCEPCPAGYKCPNTGTIVPTACGRGMWSAAGATVCTDCPVGSYCERVDTSEAMKTANTCESGYQCPLRTQERPFNDHDYQVFTIVSEYDKYSCPRGKYCTGGVAINC